MTIWPSANERPTVHGRPSITTWPSANYTSFPGTVPPDSSVVYITTDAGVQLTADGGAIIVRGDMPDNLSLIFVGQSNMVGQGTALTGLTSQDSRITYYDFYGGGVITLGPRTYDTGPSNDVGPEFSCCQGLAARLSTTATLKAFKVAKGNTLIEDWITGGADNSDLTTTLAAAAAVANAVGSGITQHIFFWMQGETNASNQAPQNDPDTRYMTKLDSLETIVTNALAPLPVTFIVGYLNDAWIEAGGVDALNGLPIRHAQETWVAAEPSKRIGISFDDINPNGNGGQHYNQTQILDIGRRYGSIAVPALRL